MPNKLDSKDLSKVTGGTNDFYDIFRKVSNIENKINQCVGSISNTYYFYLIKMTLISCHSDCVKKQYAVLKTNLGSLKLFLNRATTEYPELKDDVEQYIIPEIDNLINSITE